MSNYELIKKAITEKLQVHATFNGYTRQLCPHVLGTSNGKRICLFYQFSGQSKKGLSPDPQKNWRCMPVEQLKNIVLVEGEWHSVIPRSSQRPSCVKRIDIEVSR